MTFTERWIEWAEHWWPLLLSASLQVALVAAIALLLVGRLRRWSSPINYAILCLALLKFAMPPIWSAPTGLFSHTLSHEPSRAEPSTRIREAFVATSPRELATIVTNAESTGPFAPPTRETAPLSRASTRRPAPARPSRPLASAPLEPLERALPAPAWALGGYVLGVIGVSLGGLWLQLRLRRTRRGAQRVASGAAYQRFEACVARLGMRRPPSLLVSSSATFPIAFGVIRPAVLVPESMLSRLSTDELETVFEHELTHHRHGDLWVSGFQLLLSIAWWFHPMIWLLHRKIRQAREDWCDDAVLARRPDSEPLYCQTLLRVAASGGSPPPRAALAMATSRNSLERRFRRLLRPAAARRARLSPAAGLLILALAAVLLPGASPASHSTPTPSARQDAHDAFYDLELQEQDEPSPLPGESDQTVRAFQLRHADARDVIEALGALMEGSARSALEGRIRFTSRGSAVFARGSTADLELVASWVQDLDSGPTGADGSYPDRSIFIGSPEVPEAARSVIEELELNVDLKSLSVDGLFEVEGNGAIRSAVRDIVRLLPSETASSSAATREGRSYQVKAGDTLSRIAQQFLGSAQHAPEIAQLNRITSPAQLQVGQVLRIPSPPGQSTLVSIELEGADLRIDPRGTIAIRAKTMRVVVRTTGADQGVTLAGDSRIEAASVRGQFLFDIDSPPGQVELRIVSIREEPLVSVNVTRSTAETEIHIEAESVVLTSQDGTGPKTVIRKGRIESTTSIRVDDRIDTTIQALPSSQPEASGTVIELAAGKQDGVRVGDRFHVYRGSIYLGEVEIVETEAKRARARVQVAVEGQPMRVGDSVTNKL